MFHANPSFWLERLKSLDFISSDTCLTKTEIETSSKKKLFAKNKEIGPFNLETSILANSSKYYERAFTFYRDLASNKVDSCIT